MDNHSNGRAPVYIAGMHAVEAHIRTFGFTEGDRFLLARSPERDVRVRNLLSRAKRSGVSVERVRYADLDSRYADGHQGIVFIPGQAREITELTFDALTAAPEAAIVLVLDGIQDPHNLGAIARSLRAFSGMGLVLPRRNSAPISAAAIKSSAGYLNDTPILYCPGVPAFLLDLHRSDPRWLIIAADSAEGSIDISSVGENTPLREAIAGQPVALVLGAEGEGVSRLAGERCHMSVKIPLAAEVESLNVSVAAGILLYQIRSIKKGHISV